MKKILIVDDEENIRFLYKEELEEEGFMVEMAKDGVEAMEKLFSFEPDLVTLDIKMPVMNGMETLKRIRQWDNELPIILVSAYGEYRQDITTWASDAYVVKCADLTELKASIRKFLFDIRAAKKAPRYGINKDVVDIILGLYREICELKWEKERLNMQLKGLSKKKRKLRMPSKGERDSTRHQDTDLEKSVLGATAHSLKTEFVHIGSAVKNLKELAENSLEIRDECTIIERSIHYSQLILQRLLDYLDIGIPSLGPVNILEVLGRTESLVRPRLPSNMQLKITISKSLIEHPPLVLANVEQLMEVLLELISNATNALHEKGGTIELKLEEKEGKIVISVKDDGPGIALELREYIFRKQVSSKGGLGLGLFLCNKVVSALGGEINFRTSSEEGTIFTVVLPITSDKKENQ